MSTHALVGIRTLDGGFKAKFVHWDGYPEEMIPAIERALVLQDLQYILANHWSSFNIKDHDPSDNHDQDWYTQEDYIDSEYLYIIETDKDEYYITTYVPKHQGWVAIIPDNRFVKSDR